jgi:hypothetical protein
MVDVKISALSAISAVAGEDLVAIIDDPSVTPVSRKATIDQIKTYINTSAITASSTTTFTNKTFDADGTGNSITNIENADIKASAGIVYSKLDLSGSVANADIATSAAIAYSKLDLSSSVTNADLAGSIALSKLATDPLARANHTGTQTASTISDLNSATVTFTNKTIDGDNNTISNLAIGAEVGTALTETEEVWIPAGSFTSATTNGAEITSRETTTNTVNYHYAGFDTTTSEIAWFTWTPPANWNAGTMKFTLYWTNTAGLTTETIDFDLASVAFANDDALDTAVGAAVNVTDTWIAQNDLHITSKSASMTIAGSPAAGEQVHFKLSRDVASDNMTGDVDVIGVLLEYTVDDIGTT